MPPLSSARSSTRCCILASTASCSAVFWQCFGVVRGSTSSFSPCFAAGWQPLPPHSRSSSVLFFRFQGSYTLVFGFTLNALCLSTDTALCCANSPVPRGQAAEHSSAAPPWRHLIQPLPVAATIYPRKFCALRSVESPRNPGMRRNVVLVDRTAILLAAGSIRTGAEFKADHRCRTSAGLAQFERLDTTFASRAPRQELTAYRFLGAQAKRCVCSSIGFRHLVDCCSTLEVSFSPCKHS
jgi:hypothetical protein